MKRQALNVSINELKNLVLELMKEEEEFNISIGIKQINHDKNWLIPIINKTPNQSDTWRIEQ
jgi:hypothetical protein